ncbi:MAG: ribulose-phosphate 3-epimerase, partial [Bacilli bacterium]|nr:ribulose-phosphate 3-epimerase [Bacilli bacterium]
MRKIAASILAADPKKMKEEIRLAELSGSDFIHIDIMDGKFVKNTTWTPDFVQKIRSDSPLFLDVHIMV